MSQPATSALLGWVAREPDDVRTELAGAIERADGFSDDLIAEFQEWITDATSMQIILVAYSAFTAGYIKGFEAAGAAP